MVCCLIKHKNSISFRRFGAEWQTEMMEEANDNGADINSLFNTETFMFVGHGNRAAWNTDFGRTLRSRFHFPPRALCMSARLSVASFL
jgi:hypothetical protein